MSDSAVISPIIPVVPHQIQPVLAEHFPEVLIYTDIYENKEGKGS